jgi:hypothetical protein
MYANGDEWSLWDNMLQVVSSDDRYHFKLCTNLCNYQFISDSNLTIWLEAYERLSSSQDVSYLFGITYNVQCHGRLAKNSVCVNCEFVGQLPRHEIIYSSIQYTIVYSGRMRTSQTHQEAHVTRCFCFSCDEAGV